MQFLAKRAFTVMLIIGALGLGIAYANGAFLSSEQQGPRFGRQPETETRTTTSAKAPTYQTPLSDSTAKQLRSLGFEVVKPSNPISFTRPNQTGSPQSIQQFRDKVVVMNFWATWCPPCQKEMPSMQRLWTDMGGDRLVVLALNMREDSSKVQSFMENFGLTFPVWIDDGGVANRLQVSTLPTTWIIGPDGRPLARLVGPVRWDRSSVKAALEAVIADTTKHDSDPGPGETAGSTDGKEDV